LLRKLEEKSRDETPVTLAVESWWWLQGCKRPTVFNSVMGFVSALKKRADLWLFKWAAPSSYICKGSQGWGG